MATSSATPQGQRVIPTRPYRDFLTPSLHRRFTNAAVIGLMACWLEATLMADWHSKDWHTLYIPSSTNISSSTVVMVSIWLYRNTHTHALHLPPNDLRTSGCAITYWTEKYGLFVSNSLAIWDEHEYCTDGNHLRLLRLVV